MTRVLASARLQELDHLPRPFDAFFVRGRMIGSNELDALRDRLLGLVLIDVQDAGGDPIAQDVDQFCARAPGGFAAADDDDPFVRVEVVLPARDRQGIGRLIQAHVTSQGRFRKHPLQGMSKDASCIGLALTSVHDLAPGRRSQPSVLLLVRFMTLH